MWQARLRAAVRVRMAMRVSISFLRSAFVCPTPLS
jgi:hypothetical protein